MNGNGNPFAAMLGRKVAWLGGSWVIEDAHDTRTFLKSARGETATLTPAQLCKQFETGAMGWLPERETAGLARP